MHILGYIYQLFSHLEAYSGIFQRGANLWRARSAWIFFSRTPLCTPLKSACTPFSPHSTSPSKLFQIKRIKLLEIRCKQYKRMQCHLVNPLNTPLLSLLRLFPSQVFVLRIFIKTISSQTRLNLLRRKFYFKFLPHIFLHIIHFFQSSLVPWVWRLCTCLWHKRGHQLFGCLHLRVGNWVWFGKSRFFFSLGILMSTQKMTGSYRETWGGWI